MYLACDIREIYIHANIYKIFTPFLMKQKKVNLLHKLFNCSKMYENFIQLFYCIHRYVYAYVLYATNATKHVAVEFSNVLHNIWKNV